MPEQREKSVLWTLIKFLLVVAVILYCVWGVAWYAVTPDGLREMPLWILWAFCVAIIYLVTWPIEAVTELAVSEPVMVNFGLLLDKVGLWKVIENFGNF